MRIYRRTDGRVNMAKLKGAFRDCVNAPKKRNMSLKYYRAASVCFYVSSPLSTIRIVWPIWMKHGTSVMYLDVILMLYILISYNQQ
jgi:hypothetical protein